MKYLITGITGFVGPHLANVLLDNGHDVHGMHRDTTDPYDIADIVGNKVNSIKFSCGDLQNTESVDKIFCENKFDGVFHLGAFTHPSSSFKNPEIAFDVNAAGTIRICNAIQKYNPECILMQCSTPEIYGVCSENDLIDESFPMKPNNPYAVAKAAGDLYVMERTSNNFIKAFITRAFSHTGPRRRTNYSISSDAIQIARIIKGKQEPVIKVGNLAAKRVVMDVRDVSDVYFKLMRQMERGNIKNGDIYHISGEEIHEIGHYLDLMLKMYGLSNVKLEKDPSLFRPVDIPVQHPSSKKVRDFLNWRPLIPIETTLRDLVEYWIKYER